jgi:uncharacterized membrane protein
MEGQDKGGQGPFWAAEPLMMMMMMVVVVVVVMMMYKQSEVLI